MAKEQKFWTVLTILQWTADYLSGKGIENARLNAERLLAHVLGCQRVDLYLNFDRPLKVAESAHFKALLKRRASFEPLQYVLGETEFMSLRMKVGAGVLIPRPETEILVEKAIDCCKKLLLTRKNIAILDIGTGSGNIAIALAKQMQDVQIIAIDVSETALAFARENISAHHLSERISLYQQDIFQEMPDVFSRTFDVVVSNPPYISCDEFKLLPKEIRAFEPEAALLAGREGLAFYEKFAQILSSLCKANAFCLFEIGASMKEQMVSIFFENNFSDIQFYRDLSGKLRIMETQISHGGKYE